MTATVGTGRALRFQGATIPLPAEFQLPTCAACGQVAITSDVEVELQALAERLLIGHGPVGPILRGA